MLNPIAMAIEEIKKRALAGGGAVPASGPMPSPRLAIPGADGAPPAAPEPPPLAKSYESPPDLVQMYTKLMEQSQRTAAFQRGATMIAAGLSPYQDTRDALLATIGKGGGGGGAGAISMSDILAMQKQQQADQERAVQRAALPALIKQYGISPETATYLDSNGQLDEVIAKMNEPHTQVVTAADGAQMLIDTHDGSLIRELSPKKPRETEFLDLGGGNHMLVYKDDKSEVGDPSHQIVFTGPTAAEAKTLAETAAMPAQRKLEERKVAVTEGGLKVSQSAEQRAVEEEKVKADSRKIRESYLPLIQKQFGITEAAAMYMNETDVLDDFIKEASSPSNEVVKAADGSQMLINKKDGSVVRMLSPKAAPDTEYVKLADGSQVLVDKATGRRIDNGEVLATTPAEDPLANAKAAVAAINVEEKAAGKPLTTLGDYIRTHGTGSGSPLVQIGPTGDLIPPLDKDHRYIVDGATGKPKWFPADDTGPAGYRAEAIPGTAAALEEKKTQQEIEAGATKAEKGNIAGAEGKGYQFVQNYVVNEDAGKALDLIKEHHTDTLGITGWGALIQSSLPDNPANTLAGYLDTVQTFVELKKLDTMRANSPTGAALGNVTEKENAMLRSVMGKFNQRGEEHVLVHNLKRFKLATEMLANGIVDKSVPKTEKNPNQVRLPTEAELRDALDNVSADDLKEGVPTKGPDNVTVTKRKVTRTKPPED